MNFSIFGSLIAFLAMSSCVSSCDVISYAVTYNQAFWRRAYPFLNETFVEYCYFGNSELTAKDFGNDRVDYYCDLVSNRTQNCYLMPPFLEPMKQFYAQLAINDSKVNDHIRVLECFAKHRTEDQETLAKCWMEIITSNMTNDASSNRTTIRQLHAKTYFDRLSQVSNKIEQCLRTKNCHKPRDDFLLALHCALYHSKNDSLYVHRHCEAIKFVTPTAPPIDEQSIVRYLGHFNGRSIDPAAMFENIPEEAKAYKQLLVSCFANEEAWIDEPKHECRNITMPVEGVVYSERDRMLQAIFQNVCCRV